MASLVVQGVLVVPDGLDCVSLTVGATATALAARSFPAHAARRAVIQSDQPIRWTAASSAPPTATFGLHLAAEDTLVYDGALDALRFIRASDATGDATVIIHYFGLT